MMRWLVDRLGLGQREPDGGFFPLTVRSPKWAAFARDYLRRHPACILCGERRGVVAHHKIPVHLNPALELVESNLCTLCEGRPTLNCHLWTGHSGDWKAYNPWVIEDAAAMRARILNRPYELALPSVRP